MDPRLEKLAHNLVNYSVAVKPGDKVWINYIGESTTDLARALVKEVYAAGGLPFPHSENQRVHRQLLMGASEEQLDLMCRTDSLMMSEMDCFIGVRAADNASELAERVVNAGSVFIGPWSPESAGDYASGTNHTLPTSGYAKAYSGVNIDSFMRKITFQQLSREGLKALGPVIETMAAGEYLDAHKNAVTVRLKEL